MRFLLNIKTISVVIIIIVITSCSLPHQDEYNNDNYNIQNELTSQQIEAKNNFMDSVELADTFADYIKGNKEGQLYITKNAAEIGISQEKYDKFSIGLQLLNKTIKEGFIRLSLDSDGNIVKIESTTECKVNIGIPPADINMNTTARLNLYQHWYGIQIKLTEKETQKLMAALAVGSGASWLAAELAAAGIVTIPGSIPLGIIAAALATSTGVIWLIDNGKGISFYITWAGVYWIWAN